MQRIFVLGLLIVVTGCVVAPPRWTDADLARADDFETSLALRQEIQAEIASDPGSPNVADYRAMVRRLEARLAYLRTEQIRAELEEYRLDSGSVPLDRLDRLAPMVSELRDWDTSVWNMVEGEIAQERDRTEVEIDRANQRLDRTTPLNQPVEWISLNERVASLTGSASDLETVQRQRLEVFEQLVEAGEASMGVLDFERALDRFEAADSIRPGEASVLTLVERAQAGVFANRLSAALEQSDIHRAEETFELISNREWSSAARAKLLTPIQLLAGYYQANLRDMLDRLRFEEAYRSLVNMRALQSWMGGDLNVTEGERAFAELMFELAASAGAQGLQGTEYGFLLLLEEFDPDFVALDRLRREAAERVTASAIQWVSTPAIRGDDQTRNVGARVASAVAAFLLDNIPDDVRIVEREHLDEIQREREIDQESLRTDRNSGLRPADFLIQGSVLEMRVDQEDRTGRRTVRAVTGRRQVSNPAYEAYRADRGRRSDGSDAPPQTIEEIIEEDISLEVSIHRKTGSIAVSYRLVEAESANVLRTNSITRRREFVDEASEGIELGEFSQPFRMADLPSDGEVISELVDEVALAMAEDLIQVLSQPEDRYFENCQRHAGEGDFVEAAEECAKAAVLIDNKRQTRGEVHDTLRLMTLNSGLRPD